MFYLRDLRATLEQAIWRPDRGVEVGQTPIQHDGVCDVGAGDVRP